MFYACFVVSSCWSVTLSGSPAQTKPFQSGFYFSTVEITALGGSVSLDSTRIIASQRDFSKGGSTSVRNIPDSLLEWKEQGYFQRNRDLGQVFFVDKPVRLQSVILRTGPSDKAVIHGCQGAEVFIQFFEVKGEPRINDNGTPEGTRAKHGFCDLPRCDDFIEGITYIPLSPVFVGEFPQISSTYPAEKVNPESGQGRLIYMRWKLTTGILLDSAKRYAFLVGFRNPGPGFGFTLANTNMAALDALPGLNDLYPKGWGIRREGNGTLPTMMRESVHPPVKSNLLRQLISQSMFGEGQSRFLLSPTTDGYPDVDTYRDLEFILER